MTPSLSETFAPPSTATNGCFGSLRRPSSTSTSFCRRRPIADGSELRRADDRGVGPVRRAEGVVDVDVDALDERRHEGRIVGRLARVEAEVLEQLDARGELGQAGAHRIHRVLRVRCALRAPEVAAP